MRRGFIIVFLFLVPLTAVGKSTRETTYRYGQIWNTTVRFLRVDKGYSITEKDRKSGYLMFDYKEGGAKQLGSVELVETVRQNRRYITIGVRVDDMPSYIEVLLLDKLERKLRDEYGDPPVAVTLMPAESSDKGRGDGNDATSDDEGTTAKDENGDPETEQTQP